MIERDAVKDLVLETIQTPRSAAQKIISLYLSRDVLWTSLVLVACFNSIIFSMSLLISDTSALPPLLRNPLMFFMLVTGLQVLSVHGFYWGGRALGGNGDLGDLLSLMVWLQFLQAAANVCLFFVLLISPGIEAILSLGVGILGLWITLNFITEALHLPGLLHAVGVLVLATVGIAFGLVILAAMIGLGALGVPANV